MRFSIFSRASSRKTGGGFKVRRFLEPGLEDGRSLAVERTGHARVALDKSRRPAAEGMEVHEGRGRDGTCGRRGTRARASWRGAEVRDFREEPGQERGEPAGGFAIGKEPGVFLHVVLLERAKGVLSELVAQGFEPGDVALPTPADAGVPEEAARPRRGEAGRPSGRYGLEDEIAALDERTELRGHEAVPDPPQEPGEQTARSGEGHRDSAGEGHGKAGLLGERIKECGIDIACGVEDLNPVHGETCFEDAAQDLAAFVGRADRMEDR